MEHAVVHLADRRPSDADDLFGRSFDANSLASVEVADIAISQLETIIADIVGQVSVYEDEPRDELPADTLSWLLRAHTALAHKRRVLKAIKRRRRVLLGEPEFPMPDPKMNSADSQIAVQQAIAERKEREHRQTMERIAASNSRNERVARAFRALIREKIGEVEFLRLIKLAEEMAGEA